MRFLSIICVMAIASLASATLLPSAPEMLSTGKSMKPAAAVELKAAAGGIISGAISQLASSKVDIAKAVDSTSAKQSLQQTTYPVSFQTPAATVNCKSTPSFGQLCGGQCVSSSGNLICQYSAVSGGSSMQCTSNCPNSGACTNFGSSTAGGGVYSISSCPAPAPAPAPGPAPAPAPARGPSVILTAFSALLCTGSSEKLDIVIGACATLGNNYISITTNLLESGQWQYKQYTDSTCNTRASNNYLFGNFDTCYRVSETSQLSLTITRSSAASITPTLGGMLLVLVAALQLLF